jgi:hypothetical protein
MINFSKIDTKENLLAAIAALPDETSSASKELVAAGKTSVVALLNSVKANGAHCNFRVNSINDWKQIEVQVAGQEIKPKPAAK